MLNNMERTNTRKRTQSRVQCSKCSDNFLFYLNVTDPLIISLIFFTLTWKGMITNFVVKIQNLVVNRESRPVMPKVLTSFQTSYLANLDGEKLGKELIFIATTKRLTRKCLRISNSFMIFVWTEPLFHQTVMLEWYLCIKVSLTSHSSMHYGSKLVFGDDISLCRY